eukprot:TCALIF_02963-PA protein Name:"Protein of unknown function" AED:0.44 eAED:1.00 QI:0/0/0/1/0/0/2/0/100
MVKLYEFPGGWKRPSSLLVTCSDDFLSLEHFNVTRIDVLVFEGGNLGLVPHCGWPMSVGGPQMNPNNGSGLEGVHGPGQFVVPLPFQNPLSPPSSRHDDL